MDSITQNQQCKKCLEIKPIELFKIKNGRLTCNCKLCYGRYFSGRKWKGGTGITGGTNTKKTPEEKLITKRAQRRRTKKIDLIETVNL